MKALSFDNNARKILTANSATHVFNPLTAGAAYIRVLIFF